MAHLLIVEDDLLVQRSLMRALRSHTCVAASNGLEALKCLAQRGFDLIISDVDMPIMNGIDFYKSAREIFPNLRIIFRTGSNVPGLGSLGVPVLPKDWPLATILEEIDVHLGAGVIGEDGTAAQSTALSKVGRR